MKNNRFRFNWFWIIAPFFCVYLLYVVMLETWFPKAYDRHIKKHWIK